MTYLSIYLAGILSFLSPCILPIIPVYFTILSGTGKLIYKALFFCLGFTLVFALMGGGAGALGSFIQANKISVNILAGLILTLIGLKFLNLIQIPLLDKSYSIDSNKFKTRFTFLNAFIIGILFAITWSPCIGAVLGGVLTYVSAEGHGVISGAIKLFIYGVGISTPLILSVFFYQRLSSFYKSSPYFFDMAKKLLGFIILLFALSLFSNVAMIAKHAQGNLSATDKIMVPAKLPLFISFISSSCEDCQTMKLVVQKLESACGGKVLEFRTVNLEDNQYEYLAYQQGVFGTPTYLILDNDGKEKQRLFGVQTLESVDKNIKLAIGHSCLGL
jgi:cytochrome c-type biogenesis protein